jgi:hypothetical protein
MKNGSMMNITFLKCATAQWCWLISAARPSNAAAHDAGGWGSVELIMVSKLRITLTCLELHRNGDKWR